MARLEIDLDGVKVTARLLEDRSPATIAALKETLPVTGNALHAKWGGPFLYLLLKDKPRLEGLPFEKPIHIVPPGTVLFHPGICELVVAYDDVRFNDYGRTGNYGSVIGEIEQDLTELAEQAHKLRTEGAKKVTFRLID